MLAYSTIGVKDMEKAKAFYGELLGELGGKIQLERPDGGFVAYSNGSGSMFAIARPYDGGEASAGNGAMMAIACDGPEQVKSMYEKAISLGATDDGTPGPRLGGAVSCGYVRDSDGNKLNFFCMGS